MKPQNRNKTAKNTQAENVERAAWFARLAFGDWGKAAVPAPTRHSQSSFYVMP
jgi:hypothetical protein